MVQDSSPPTITQRVVEAISEATGTDPLELEPLYDTVDPDCLENLFTETASPGSQTNGRVSFTASGCRVTVWSDGDVEAELVESQSARTPERTRGTDSTEIPESTD